MRRLNTSNSDQLVYVEGGGCVIAIGVAFFLAGLLFFFPAITGQISFDQGRPPGTLEIVGVSLFTSMFVILGAILMVHMGGMTFDRKTHTAQRWWGVRRVFKAGEEVDGVPANVRILKRSEVSPITDYTKIGIEHQIRTVGKNKDSQETYFVVQLAAKPALTITECTDELEARQAAAEVAMFLGLGILDRSSGTAFERPAGTVEQHLRERLALADLPAGLPPPLRMRATYRVEDGRLIFTSPRESFDPFLLVHLLAPIAFVCLVYWFFLKSHLFANIVAGDELKVIVVAVIFLVLPVVFGLMTMLGAIHWGGTLEIAAKSLRIFTRGQLFGGVVEVPISELDEVRVNKAIPKAWRVRFGDFSVSNDPNAQTLELEVIGKKQIGRFGRGLGRAELEWMRDVVLKSVAV